MEIAMKVRPLVDDVGIKLTFVAHQEGGSASCTFYTTIDVLAEPDVFGGVASDPIALSIIGLGTVGTVLISIFAYVVHGRRRRRRIDAIREERRRLRHERRGSRQLSEAEILARREELRHRRMKRRASRRRRKWLEQHDRARERKGRRR